MPISPISFMMTATGLPLQPVVEHVAQERRLAASEEAREDVDRDRVHGQRGLHQRSSSGAAMLKCFDGKAQNTNGTSRLVRAAQRAYSGYVRARAASSSTARATRTHQGRQRRARAPTASRA